MAQPTVAVIVPCHNYHRWLTDCVYSLLLRRPGMYRPLRMITVHDGCDGASDEIVKSGDAATQECICILQSKNRGVSVARNRGLDAIGNAKYVWFLDADDMAIPGGIERRMEYLEAHPDVDMVWGNALKINVDRGNWDWSYDQCMKGLRKLERYSRWMNAQTLLWRREVFAEFGGYYEPLRSKEDKELIYRLGIHPDSPFKPRIKAKHLDVDVAIYRRHPDAKHKMRVADKKWFAECERVFAERMKQLKREGITHQNTRFPVWAEAALTEK